MTDAKTMGDMARACSYWSHKASVMAHAQLHANGVQMFVERGDRVRSYIMRWGDIEKAQAPLPLFHAHLEALCEQVRR